VAPPPSEISNYYMPPTKAAPVFRDGTEYHAGPHPPFLRPNSNPPPPQAMPATEPNGAPQQVESKP
jgi:hypothetical protein